MFLALHENIYSNKYRPYHRNVAKSLCISKNVSKRRDTYYANNKELNILRKLAYFEIFLLCDDSIYTREEL